MTVEMFRLYVLIWFNVKNIVALNLYNFGHIVFFFKPTVTLNISLNTKKSMFAADEYVNFNKNEYLFHF